MSNLTKITCKEIDTFASFLARLTKVGDEYIIKNDCMICTKKNNWDTGKIPGMHVVRFPFTGFNKSMVENGIYYIESLMDVINKIKGIKLDSPSFRKNVYYVCEEEELFLIFEDPIAAKRIEVSIARLLRDEIRDDILNTAKLIDWFDNLYNERSLIPTEYWARMSDSDLDVIKEGGIVPIVQEVDKRHVSTRLAKSLFMFSGVKRKGAPIANNVFYTFFPSQENDVSLLRIYASYPCGSGTMYIETIHDYLVLIYEEGGTG